jgi:hypothetical protein
MKTSAIIFIIFVIVLLAGVGVFYNQKKAIAPSPSPTLLPTSSPTTQTSPVSSSSGNLSLCKPSQLDGDITTEGAAGSIYGNVTIKNISSTKCTIMTSNLLEAQIPTSITNITTSKVTNSDSDSTDLAPGQTIYAQIRVPNGPQCQGPTKTQNISFIMTVSKDEDLNFKTPTGKTLSVQACAGSEKTDIQIWGWSDKPISQ